MYFNNIGTLFFAVTAISAVGGISLSAVEKTTKVTTTTTVITETVVKEKAKWSSIFLFFRKILSTSNRRIFRVSKGGAFSLLEKFSGRNWNFILPQKEFEHRENGRKEIRTSDLYS